MLQNRWPALVFILSVIAIVTLTPGLVEYFIQNNSCGLYLIERHLVVASKLLNKSCSTTCLPETKGGHQFCFQELVLNEKYSRAAEFANDFSQVERDLMGEWLIERGKCLLQRGDALGAKRVASLAQSMELRSPKPLYNLGFLWRDLDAPERAIAAFGEAHAYDDVCPEAALFRQAQIQYWTRLDVTRALDNAEKVVQSAAPCLPEDDVLSAAIISAELWLDQGQLEQAYERLVWAKHKIAADSNRQLFAIECGLGSVAEAQTDFSLAESHFMSAYDASQTLEERALVLHSIGALFDKQARWVEAYVFYQQGQFASADPAIDIRIMTIQHDFPCLTNVEMSAFDDMVRIRSLIVRLEQLCH